MKHIKMKTRDYYIPLIKSCIKKHEYRLADPKFAKICVGDTLILISNENPMNYAKVIVNKIEHYKTWDEALRNSWYEDFKGLFDTYDELISECQKYYPIEKVDEYGITVFSIEPLKINFKNARYLFDTNIIIEKESSANTSAELSLVYSWIDKVNGTKLIRSDIIENPKNFFKAEFLNSVSNNLGFYEKFYLDFEKDEYFDSVCGRISNENEKTENNLLLQVYNGKADFLITYDSEIINNAKRLCIREKVITPYEFLVLIEKEYPKLIEHDVLSIRLIQIGKLDIDDRFFDSLREDYGTLEFNNWLKKKSDEKAYIFKNNEELHGFLYLKTEYEDEVYSHISPTFKPAKRLKVGTFKIDQPNLRLGERFIKIIIDNAIKGNVDEVFWSYAIKKDDGKMGIC